MYWFECFYHIWVCFFEYSFVMHWLIPIMLLAFIATVPRLIRLIVTWR